MVTAACGLKRILDSPLYVLIEFWRLKEGECEGLAASSSGSLSLRVTACDSRRILNSPLCLDWDFEGLREGTCRGFAASSTGFSSLFELQLPFNDSLVASVD